MNLILFTLNWKKKNQTTMTCALSNIGRKILVPHWLFGKFRDLNHIINMDTIGVNA
jgi:hypothetical protein